MEKRKPTVSVAMASYNGAKYIKEQLNSIISQTYKDFEIVVCDDCSTDNTLQILKEYEKDYGIRVISNQTKNGPIKNFAKAVTYSKGSYIAFSDQDDFWKPDKLEKVLLEMTQLENKFGKSTPCLVFTDLEVVDKDLCTMSRSYLRLKKLNPEHIELKHLLVENVPTGCAMLINRALADLVQEIPAQATMHDVFISLVASCFGKMKYLDESTLLYRQHSSNVYGVALKSHFAVLKSTLKVLFDKDANREFLTREIKQAEAFLVMFKDNFTTEQKIILQDFIKIKSYKKLLRVWILLKHGISKGSIVKTLNLYLKV